MLLSSLIACEAGDLFIAGRIILASGGRSAIYKQAALVAICSCYQNWWGLHTFSWFVIWHHLDFACLLVCLFVCLFVCSFVCSFVRSFVRSFVHMLVQKSSLRQSLCKHSNHGEGFIPSEEASTFETGDVQSPKRLWSGGHMSCDQKLPFFAIFFWGLVISD